MKKVIDFIKEHNYLMILLIFIGFSISLSLTYSNFIVTSNNHKAAEMYIGELKYSMEIDESSTNTLTVPAGETIIDVKVNNLNPVDTYYKLLYLKNTNITIKYYESTKDTDEVVTTYNKPNDSVTSSDSNNIKLLITNNSASSQNIALTMKGGYITNTLEDIVAPSTYSEITLVETPSTNTYFCTTTDTLTQGLQYVNGQYTYAYKQQGKTTSSGLGWSNISNNGWGVQLTDKSSTNAVTSKVCTYINNKSIASMSYMFYNSQATTLDLSNFNTSKVTNMTNMFNGSQATVLDLSNFDTSNVRDMGFMFFDSQATTLDVSNFDTSKVIYMSYMFHNSQATTLDLSSFDTSKVIDMESMFSNTKATTLNLNSFDTSKVTNMQGIFQYSQAAILDISNFNTSNVTNMNSMFWNSKAKTLDVSNFDTSNVTNMGGMFGESQATTLDVSNFDTSKVIYMTGMFSSSQAATLDLSNFDTSNVTNMTQMFANSYSLATIYVSDKFKTDKVTDSTNMFTDSTKLVGGAGTKYNSSYIDKTYARIDGGTSNPGYFTDAANKPSTFPTDDWATIVASVKAGNTRGYKVGETKTVDMGTYGTHTLRIANTSTPSECSTEGFSQTACGFVLEFADIITTHNMNRSATNFGGWPSSTMRTFVNNDIYNLLPDTLKSGIIDTTIISNGSSSSSKVVVTSTDKLYLPSTAEIYTSGSMYDGAASATRQFDYYANLNVTSRNLTEAIKKNGDTESWWWMRSIRGGTDTFFLVGNSGTFLDTVPASTSGGVSPAFRIG